ncbi:MAG TPA: type II toxin-antitoxin system HicB family antitoxin [Gammaproteobacteria bacterium]|jgi:predicted RNase H-like HicB family nuclease|nr:type II toxin-antitoxin system HicB family antitoxin [Gammaproteobacteria bacterium]
MLRNLTAIFELAEEGSFVCWFQEIPEMMSQRDALDEAKTNLLDALKEVVAYRREAARQKITHANSRTAQAIQTMSITV